MSNQQGEIVSEHVRNRREKLMKMQAAGINPYPVSYPRTAKIGDLRITHAELAPGSHTGLIVGVAGRVMLSRTAGKLCFATIRDDSGDIQVMISLDGVGEESLTTWKQIVDLGDHIGVTGEIITSKRGELSILANSWAITAKCLRPLPDKHHGLTDQETRIRQRYVDLIVNPEARQMAHIRSNVVRSLRTSFYQRGYLEVETPMLLPVHGGANARPFTTHINAYNLDLYLRIAPELNLKRLAVGGMEKIFEINRNFRNEGADSTHNPEFTMLEFYAAYETYDSMAVLTRELIQEAARTALGTTVVERDGRSIDLAGEWRSITVYGAVSEALGAEVTPETELAQLHKHANALGLSYNPQWGQGKLVVEIFEELVEHTLIEPTFVRDFPKEVSPLTRVHRDHPLLAEKWDLIAFGMELATGFSELIDPVDQRERFTAQALLAAEGDPEAMQLDEDFLRALEYAMPPSGGVGVGIDRLVMALTGTNIRETILFPIVKPE